MTRRISSPILVGREGELARLRSTLSAATAGRPGTVVVAGEAGVGKTRLVEGFARIAQDGGARVLRGGAVPVGEGSLAYGPLVEALRGLARSPDRSADGRLLGSLRPELVGLLPGLRPTLVPATGTASGAGPAIAAGPIARERLLELLLTTIDRLTTVAPTILVLEDMHWSDRSTLDAVTYLHRNLRDQRALLVLTFRRDDPGPSAELRAVLAELERAGRTEWLELARFDRDDLGRIVAGILGAEPEPGLVRRVHERSGGNAYFAEELLALGGLDGPLPPTLRDVLLARVDGLDERGRSLLRVASAEGRRFDGGLVSLVDGLDREAAVLALREAASRHIVVPVAGAGETFEFRHALLAEAVYESLLPADRVRLHGAWARVLQTRSGELPERVLQAELARHWLEAGDLAQAFAASIRAGLAARADHSFADAGTQLERALALWPRIPEAEALAGMDRPALLELAAEVAQAAGSPRVAADHLRAAISLVDPAIDPVRVGLLDERLAFALFRSGRHDASRSARVEAVRLVPDEPGSRARARVVAGWARELMALGPLDEAHGLAERARDLARDAGARDIEADALATLGAVQGHVGDLEVALETLGQARALASEAGDLMAESRARINRALILEGESCIREAIAAADWCDRHGLADSSAPRCGAARAMLELGRWDEAERMLDHVRSSGAAGIEWFERWSRCELDIGRGRQADAATAIEAFWAAMSSMDLSGRIGVLGLEVELAHVQGRWIEARDGARRALRELAAWPPGVAVFNARIMWHALRAEAETATTSRARHGPLDEDAVEHAGRALALARSTAGAMTGVRAVHWRRPATVAALCEAEWTRFEGHSDADAWGAAAAACSSSDQLALRPYALLRQAEATLGAIGLRRGRDVATPLLREAGELSAGMGAAPLLGQIETLAHRSRIDLAAAPASVGSPVPPGPPDPFGLTSREREVLALVAAGRTNREIAEELFITEGTASVHVSNILGKLGVARRTEAGAVAVRLRLVD